jgi:hypothetical protein
MCPRNTGHIILSYFMASQDSNNITLRWVYSEGGPLLLIEERFLDEWGGVIDHIQGPREEKSYSPDGKRTDYDRACAVSEYIGRIDVGTGAALVLGDMPMQTTWISKVPWNGGMLARWMFAESDAEFSGWLQTITGELFHPEFKFFVEQTPLVLFDSGFAGRNIKKRMNECLLIALEPGSYEISTAIYQPDNQTSMVLHRFILLDIPDRVPGTDRVPRTQYQLGQDGGRPLPKLPK